MRFYIATRLENHAAHNELRDALLALGHEISYDWTTHGPVWRKGVEVIQQTAIAERDGIESADVVVALLPGGRGTHAEIGIALGKRIPLILHAPDDSMFGATPETCAFYHGPDTLTVFDTPISNLAKFVNEAMALRFRTGERCLFIANTGEIERCGLRSGQHRAMDKFHPFEGETERKQQRKRA